jgi:hypothetical protein
VLLALAAAACSRDADRDAGAEPAPAYHAVLHDPEDRASAAFRTFGLPETFLIDADGRPVHRWRGKVDGDSRDFGKSLDDVLEKGT